MTQPRSLYAGLLALSLSVSLTAGCATPAANVPVAPTTAVAPASEPSTAPAVVTVPASVAPVTLNGTATFQGSPLAGYTLEVFDAKTGKPVEKKADLTGVTTLALLDKGLKVAQDGKFSLQVVGLSAGQALRVVCRSESGVAKLETLVFGDRQALKYTVQQASDIAFELNELTTALSHSARGVLTSSTALKPEAAAAVLSKLAGDLGTLSAKFQNVLKNSPAFAGELVRANSPNEQANTMRSLVENAGVLRQLTQMVADRISEISQQAKETGNQNPDAASPEIQALLKRVEFLGTRIAGQLDNKAVELIYGDSRQPINGSDLSNFITKATTSHSSGSSAPTALTEAQATALRENLNNQDADTDNDEDRRDITSGAITEVLDLLKTNKVAFGDDWNKFLALAPEDLPTIPDYRVLGAASYTQRQQTVGQLVLERVFRNKNGDHSGYRVLTNGPDPVPYATLQEVQTAFHEAVAMQTHARSLLAAVKAALPDTPPRYRILTPTPYTDRQEAILRSISISLLGQIRDDFSSINAWRLAPRDSITTYSNRTDMYDYFINNLYSGETLSLHFAYLADLLLGLNKSTLTEYDIYQALWNSYDT